MYLPAGPTRPDPRALEAFWAEAKAARPGAIHARRYGVRWIGLDAPTTQQIFELISVGDKRGTFSLPWIFEPTGQADPVRGECVVLIDFDGKMIFPVIQQLLSANPAGNLSNQLFRFLKTIGHVSRQFRMLTEIQPARQCYLESPELLIELSTCFQRIRGIALL